MKISKLFHWLYGLVMLLPIFAIGVTCGYAMFNKNAYQSYDKKEVVSNIQLSGNYVANNNAVIKLTPSNEIGSQTGGYSGFLVSGSSIQTLDEQIYTVLNMPREFTLQSLQVGMGSNGRQINLHYNNAWHNTANVWGNTITHLELVFVNGETISIPNSQSNTNVWAFITQYKQTTTLQNIFYDSVDKVTQSDLFNWAYDSFLVAPFSYIVSLFSMPTNSPVVMFMSYWLAISIIWLVFDLVMYVPLLVHRWLDKGGIE